MTTHAITLDIWGTLIGSDPAYRPAWNEAVYDALDLTPDMLERATFDVVTRWANKAADVMSEADGRNRDLIERLDLALSYVGGSPHTFHHYLDDKSRVRRVRQAQLDVLRVHPPRPLTPDVAEVLGQIESQGRVIVRYASNTGNLSANEMQTLVLPGCGFPDFGGVFSDELGACKPNPHFFVALEASTGVPASCAVSAVSSATASSDIGTDSSAG